MLHLCRCSYSHENAPIKKELGAIEVGQVAAFLLSPLASAGESWGYGHTLPSRGAPACLPRVDLEPHGWGGAPVLLCYAREERGVACLETRCCGKNVL